MGKPAKRFEDLRVWQQALGLVGNVYRDFENGFGVRDQGFRDQVQQAAVSLMNCIAEGFERESAKAFAKCLDRAKGACGEVRSMYYIAENQDYVDSQIAKQRRKQTVAISRGIASLMKHLRKAR